VLRTLEGALAGLHVPYSNGWAIIALTAAVKLATFPFTKIQVRPGARWSCCDSGT
jgi:YidC/Oxa1 family membrane protein insertase